MRVAFDSLFKTAANGSLIARRHVNINGDVLGPGTRITRKRLIGGINLHAWIGHDLEIDERPDAAIITGVY